MLQTKLQLLNKYIIRWVINNPLNGHGIVFNSTTSRFENGLVGGGGAGVDFSDGGTATQASASIQIILNGAVQWQ